ncbi:hypothetical protein [Actinomadura sp. DC4]|uniref:hypothetical protein n=1 Tax=Actinomadura sp. DC4 TaxID=3055069 RepID=UPI0025B1354B|nr:hypothetical protein [Actinomadura sp. DC4]MDN3351982.1 hypothetical protein [Actinomadura sp. DC4]
MIWAIDAAFKWLPGFIHGQKLDKELGGGSDIHTPVIHQWLRMWHGIGTAGPGAFAVGTAIVETLIAAGLLLGVIAALALYCAAAGSTWSLDRTLCGRLGRYAWLTSPAPHAG